MTDKKTRLSEEELNAPVQSPGGRLDLKAGHCAGDTVRDLVAYMGAREGGQGPHKAVVESAVDKLDVVVADQVGPARALPVGVLNGQVGQDLYGFNDDFVLVRFF